VETPPPGQQP